MSNALLTAASGLIAHQKLLDVVGHNIANINTTAYKSQRALFSDLFYETLSPATSPSVAGLGGTNASQIGHGVRLSQIDRNFAGGSLEATGEEFDMAIQGDGFFVVSDGKTNLYTRAGTFSLDADGVLVAPGGLEVQRLPFIGEPNGTNVGFQIPGNSQIRIPQNALIPAEPTSEIVITGNLSSTASYPMPTVKTTLTPLQTQNGLATESTLLNDLTSNSFRYESNDQIHIEGIDVGGAVIDVVLDVSAGTTVGDLIAAINGKAVGFQASMQGGNIVLEATETGETEFDLSLRDGRDNAGHTLFAIHGFALTGLGTEEGIVPLTTQVVDPRGLAHVITLNFERLSQNDWRMVATMDPSEGSVENGIIEPIEFTDSGTLKTTGDGTIGVKLNGFADLQIVRLSFDDPSTLQQPTNQGDNNTAMATGNGHLSGTLTHTKIDADGTIIGIDSNGRRIVLAQLAIASFQNVKGLEGVRDSLYASSLNSGQPEIGAAGTNRRGTVESGNLESSNVDIGFEFTRLIVAQRGFSANARTVTVADKVLEELTNIVR
jgi:flagellar hook protein FlgE